MPKNSKDSSGGKNNSDKKLGEKAVKQADKGAVGKKSDSPVGSMRKGEKKTTP